MVDTSILMAVLREEEDARFFSTFLRDPETRLAISEPTLVEASIAAERRLEGRGGAKVMQNLCRTWLIEPVPFDISQMAWAMEGYERFGEGGGEEPLALNFGDCFSYALAMARDAPLAFVGKDFKRTNVRVAEIPGVTH